MSSFEDFITERRLLLNVSPATLSWYKFALKWLPNEQPTMDELKTMVLRMRERGLKPTGCNAACRAINVYLRWSGSPHRISKLKEPQLVLPTFTPDMIRLLISADYNPQLKNFILFMLDTGARLSEALGVKPEDVGDGTVILHGKGGKDRIVPWSVRPCPPYPWTRFAALKMVKRQCRKLGFTPPRRTCHSLRHTFATFYMRNGGSVFHLQAMLGHSSLDMSRRYCTLGAADLIAAHRSPLTVG